MKKKASKILSTVVALSILCSTAYASGTASGGMAGATTPNENQSVPAVALPTATVTELDVSAIEGTDLTFALNFVADDVTSEQLETYGDWYADFVFTVNKAATFNSNGTQDGYLAGQYDTWSPDWVTVPFSNVSILADEPVKIMETASAGNLTYRDVYNNVRDFDCGVYFDDEFLAANPDIYVTLELVIYNPENVNEKYTIGDTHEFEIEKPTATVTELNVLELTNVDLTYALNFLADEVTDAQLAAYGDWYADFVLTINKAVTFNSNGTQDGYLAGQYDTWSPDWVTVPFSDVAISANQPVKVMETASAGNLTYREVYNNVNDFDCGVFFDNDFLLANPDLTTTLELRIYNPNNLNESYIIGDSYEFEVTTTNDSNVQGTVSGNAVLIQGVNASAAAQNESVTLDTNDFVPQGSTDAVINTVSLPATVVSDVSNLGSDAKLNMVLANDGNDITITMNKDALDAIATDVANDNAQNIIINIEEADNLTQNQITTTANLNNKKVYTLSIETENGTPIFDDQSAQDNRQITVNIPYQPVGSGNIYVQFLMDDGTLLNVPYTFANNTVTITLSHFSEYVIYQEQVVTSGGGSGIAPVVSVEFDSNGGSKLGIQKVRKGKTIIKPADPTKEGFVFDGWYLDKEFNTEFSFDTEITKSIILYAKWIENGESKEPVNPDEPDVQNVGFTDVKEDAWYFENVKYANENGLMKGLTETTFGPDDKLTRAMFVAILYRAEGEPAVNKSIPFGDIEAGAYYENAVIWAQQHEIVSGVTENEFKPDAFITREQMAAIMFRYAKYKEYDVTVGEDTNILSYDDAAQISEYAIPAIQYASGSGLLKGKTESTINPKDNTTRAEIAAVLQRFIEGNKAN